MSERLQARYSGVAIALHWVIAALIALQVALAGRMEDRTPEAFAVTQFHKSIGITILLLSLARLAWRLMHRPPPEPAGLASWERTLAHAVHWAFYAVMILMPVTGWIMVSASRIELPTLLFDVVPWPHLPGLPDMAPAAKEAWREGAEAAHEAIMKGAYGLVALHVAGALKHHLVDRDAPVLPRMAPGAVTGRWWEPRLAAMVLGLAAVIAFGRLYDPPRRAQAPLPPPVVEETRESVAAAPAAPVVAAAPAAKPSPRWTVRRGSTLGFATAWSGEAIEGRFDRWTADVVFDPDDLASAKVSVSIDMASARTGDDQRDASLPAPDWFDTASHPKATFTATRFEKTGEGRYVARGNLSLRGVSRPLSLPFRLTIDGDRATVAGVTSLDRTAFGVGQGEWASSDQIPAKVSVRIDLKAVRAP
ncbi:MAG: cytochrome B [Phenylobacterium sp.]|uniref:YceI family protein n=1 Tax=Phenylobacterium sp. TaxID=1871053 RepID=UPI0011FF8AF1|nr:YceI family protein [Phenylobacterium sp.]TAL29838.1 MAG: cytochrome B [Phenylobacterium sp.]